MSKEGKKRPEITGSSLSRRSVLQIGALAGLGLIGADTISGFVNGPNAQAASTAATGEKPQSEGTLITRLASDPPNFDLISNSTYMTQHPMAPIYNNLVMFDPMDPKKIVGELAEKWKISPDGKMYTFSLIKGLKFHDGKPCSSADVKFTFDIIRNPPQGMVSPRKGSLSVVDGIETPDGHTVRFILKRPSPSLLTILAQGWMGVLPKHIIEAKGDMKKDAIGTGPFKLKNYTRGVSIELVRNPEYHLKGRPYLDGIKYFIIPDPGTAMANLRTGQLHINGLRPDEMRTVKQEFPDKVVIQECPYLVFNTLNFNSKRKPWDDVRVRQAVSLAIDRTEAVKVLEGGDADISGYMPPSGIWALPQSELAKIPGYGKDAAANLAAAKKLLAEAGYPNGFSTTLLTRKGTDFEPFSVFLKDQLSKVGIDAKLDVQETAAAYALANKKAFDLVPWVHGIALDDPDAVFSEFYTCTAMRNYSDVCDQEVDKLFAKQSETMNLEERKKLVHEMERLALLSYSKIMLYYQRRFMAFSPAVRNYKIHPSLYNNQRFQDVWLAKK